MHGLGPKSAGTGSIAEHGERSQDSVFHFFCNYFANTTQGSASRTN